MRKHSLVVLAFIVAVLSLSACGGPPVQPLSFRPAPWSAGEVSQYDLLNRDGKPVGSATWTWERTANQWQQRYELTVNNTLDSGVVILGADLKPIRSSREVGGKRYETTYGDKTVDIITTAADGSSVTRSMPAAVDGIDNDASLQVQRALPLGPNYATQYTDIIPTTAGSAPIVVSVTGAETVTVPAGTFPTWRVKMAFSGSAHDGWYSQEPPYALVKYQNRASGAVFELRSISTGAAPAAASQATPAPTATPGSVQSTAPAAASLPPVNVLLMVVIFGVQLPIMIGLPILLGWYIRRRWGVSWSIFGVGMLTFVLSQVVHIPLNSALGLVGAQTHGAALWPLIPKGLLIGLSAAVCEEGARLLVITAFARHIRGWRAGLQFGAGHGGFESLILGLLVAVNVLAVVASRSMAVASQVLPADAIAQLRGVQEAFWAQSPLLPLVGGAERILALALQVALGVLVVRAVTRRQPLYFVLALVVHALVDAWSVWAQSLGIAAIEAGAGLAAIICLWLLWRLREQPAAAAAVLRSEPESASVPTAADLSERQLSPEELARRADRSRYE